MCGIENILFKFNSLIDNEFEDILKDFLIDSVS